MNAKTCAFLKNAGRYSSDLEKIIHVDLFLPEASDDEITSVFSLLHCLIRLLLLVLARQVEER